MTNRHDDVPNEPAQSSNLKGDGGASQVANKLHEEQEKGYNGEVPDKTPNSAYTVAGQIGGGEKTPEGAPAENKPESEDN